MKTLKKKYNKIKKLALAKAEALKDSFKAQSFYLVDFLNKSAPSLRGVLNPVCMMLTTLVIALGADSFHTSYIESKVGENTVFIRSPEGAKLQGSGTAFEVKAPSGKVYTITNAHVCGLEKDGIVMLGEKKHSQRLVPKRILEVYQDNDLCIVEGLDGYDGLSLGSETDIGQSVWAVGYPLGEALNISKGRVKSFGPVMIIDQETPLDKCVGKNKHIDTMNLLFFDIQVCVVQRQAVQTDLLIYPGNSGSPMTDYWGRVVGVVFASNSQSNWGSAVPLKDLTNLLKAY